jgi:hypothetical protein
MSRKSSGSSFTNSLSWFLAFAQSSNRAQSIAGLLVNVAFSQRLKLVPRHEFETLAKQRHSARRFRAASPWSQFVSLPLAQLTGRNSLRDIVENMLAQTHRLYHWGNVDLSRSHLSRMNEDKPYALYEALCGWLLARCQNKAPGHSFRFKSPLYALGASIIDLCVYLLIAFVKFQSKLTKSMRQMLWLLQLSLFEKRDLMASPRGDPLRGDQMNIYQMALV